MQSTQEQEVAEDALIAEELRLLAQPGSSAKKWSELVDAPSMWSSVSSQQASPHSDPNKHRFSHYADKQLFHLVLAEEFDFARIAALLNYVFREERARFTEAACRERWEELYLLRADEEQVRLKRMEDKRASSVSTFSDPFCLYNLEEMLDKLQQTQRHRPSEAEELGAAKAEGSGYNIFKNSIRQIDDMEGYRRREGEMLRALSLAQDPSQAISDRLMHFSPYYDRLNEFQVREEELTEEKMKEIMSNPIEMEHLELELRVKDMNETAASHPKRPRREEQRTQEEHRYEIEEDWDEYESD